jgi:hypothetical protein
MGLNVIKIGCTCIFNPLLKTITLFADRKSHIQQCLAKQLLLAASSVIHLRFKTLTSLSH